DGAKAAPMPSTAPPTGRRKRSPGSSLRSSFPYCTIASTNTARHPWAQPEGLQWSRLRREKRVLPDVRADIAHPSSDLSLARKPTFVTQIAPPERFALRYIPQSLKGRR